MPVGGEESLAAGLPPAHRNARTGQRDRRLFFCQRGVDLLVVPCGCMLVVGAPEHERRGGSGRQRAVAAFPKDDGEKGVGSVKRLLANGGDGRPLERSALGCYRLRLSHGACCAKRHQRRSVAYGITYEDEGNWDATRAPTQRACMLCDTVFHKQQPQAINQSRSAQGRPQHH